jgi:photosystem II stability/assembly factor-like uncharacterized protein
MSAKLFALCLIITLEFSLSIAQWEDISNPAFGYIKKVKFITQNNGWLISSFGSQEGLFYTTDSGSTWRRASPLPPGTFNFFNEFDFVNDSIGFTITGRDSCYLTMTGGRTWNRTYPFIHAAGSGKPNVSFLKESNAFFCDGTWFSFSADTAKTWQLRYTFPINHDYGGIFDIEVLGERTFIAGGGLVPFVINEWTGTTEIYRSTDEGITWERTLYDTAHYLITSLAFTKEKIGYAFTYLAQDTSSLFRLRNFKTTNEGISWSLLPAQLDSGSMEVTDAFFRNPLNGFACGERLVFTSDGGLTWQTIHSVQGDFFTSMSWIDSLHGWVVGSNGKIYRTTNGGGLPIQLASFTGRHLGGTRVRLDWRTLSETNNLGFYVQRRRETDSAFTEISSLIPGYGTTNEPHDYTWTDTNATIARWYYRLKQVDLGGPVHFTEPIVVDVTTSVREQQARYDFRLEQNYPNPFNPTTNIKFQIPRQTDGGQANDGLISLKVFNMLGQEVTTLVNEVRRAGSYEVTFDASHLASGVYIYKLTAANFSAQKKLILMK